MAADLPPNSPEEVARLNHLAYDDYLTSIWWKRRRHARLRTAGGKCERCARVTTAFDVHHVYYDRLGAERDRDLEVLCRDCHEGHHHDETRKHNLGVYLKLADETIRLEHPTTTFDLKLCLVARCRKLRIPIDHRIDDAISAKQGNLSLVSEARRREVATILATAPHLPPVSHAEAVECLRRLGLTGAIIKSMPSASGGFEVGLAAIRRRAANRLTGTNWTRTRRRPRRGHDTAVPAIHETP